MLGVLLHAPRARALSAKKSTLLGPSRVCVVDAPLARPLLRVSPLPFSFFLLKNADFLKNELFFLQV